MAKFLQDTLEEMALQAKGESHSQRAKEFAEFFEKIRKSGQQASNEDIMKFSKIFEDEITLDSLTRPQLIALCRLLELQPIGTNPFLRFQLRMKLKSLKADDKMIEKEGISSLTVPELQQACRARGMRALGVPETRLRSQLAQWLELSLNEEIPPSLLLLSRVLYLPEDIPPTDQLKATIQALPKEAATEAKYRIGEVEGKIDNKTKIELIKQEEEAIKKEKEEAAAKEAEKVVQERPAVDTAESIVDKAMDLSGKEFTQKVPKELLKEELVKIEPLELSEEEKYLDEKEEIEDLKEEMRDYHEDMEEFNELAKSTGIKELRESKGAKRVKKKVDKMINKLDDMVQDLDLEHKKEGMQKCKEQEK